MMNNLGHFTHNVVVSLVKCPLEINHSIRDAQDLVVQLCQLSIELILDLLGADGLMDVLLQVGSVFVSLVTSAFLFFHLDLGIDSRLFLAVSGSRFVSLLDILMISMHHVADVAHDFDLLWVKHILVLMSIIIPTFWVTRVILGKNKDLIISSKLRCLLRIGDHVLERAKHTLFFFAMWKTIHQPLALFIFLLVLIFFLISIKINLDFSIEPNRNDVPPCGKRIKELRILSSNEFLWYLNVIQVTDLNVREVSVKVSFPLFLALVLRSVSDDQLLQHNREGWVEISLAD